MSNAVRFVLVDGREIPEGHDDYDASKHIHCHDKTNPEFTLCGFAFEGYGGAYGFENCTTFIEVKEKINCPQCITKIRFVKSIKKSEIDANASS